MAAMGREMSGGVALPGYRPIAVLMWGTGLYMTYQFLYQIVGAGLGMGWTFITSLILQIILTYGQSPVWNGRFGAIGVTCLLVDALINFGGVMFFIANIDRAGSVVALVGSFGVQVSNVGGAASLDWPMGVKAIIALVFAAMIAGLPEFFWKQGR